LAQLKQNKLMKHQTNQSTHSSSHFLQYCCDFSTLNPPDNHLSHWTLECDKYVTKFLFQDAQNVLRSENQENSAENKPSSVPVIIFTVTPLITPAYLLQEIAVKYDSRDSPGSKCFTFLSKCAFYRVLLISYPAFAKMLKSSQYWQECCRNSFQMFLFPGKELFI
jgi:hypothetical protein